MATFPPELVQITIYGAWHSEIPSYIQKSFMTTCPSIKRTVESWICPCHFSWYAYRQLRTSGLPM
ncbi:hypothetical protein ARMSODRAFT_382703 [Armillaria solidipes]|uniref:Uncharacterized protein n=1 Tax=Armillaria solidipes TaxID=1076256 RepID=A0A2H3B4Y3_9AGAR|nr:hypothetical protein ARMSODRAFT_382703 [Armillaria solidipes]